MIYLAFSQCDSSRESQHREGRRLLSFVLEKLGYPDTEILISDSGRPYIEAEDIDFSISHSEECAIVAIACNRTIEDNGIIAIPVDASSLGADIEYVPKKFDLEQKNRLAKRFLKADITSKEEFFRLWTRNEAYGKMTGEGVISKKEKTCSTLSFNISFDEKSYILSIAYK
ncbi:MAG: hypothetical protein IJD22_07905 [Clostridia bacterium]|nr:hypothetical protein [Clostridia bacterium]